jgi:3-methyladenine DNA glycosylase AlkD
MEILGAPVPEIRKILRPLARSLRGEPASQVLDVARSLLGTDVHEARQMAFELVGGRKDVLDGLDAELIESLGCGNDNWASVDCFSVFVSGPCWRNGAIGDEDVLRWARSEDRWWRRTALVSTVPLNMRSRGGTGDVPCTLRVCTELVGDPDPMVAKALSWALRSLCGIDPGAVEDFLHTHGDAVPALVRREVTNKLTTGLKGGGRRPEG